MTPAGVVASMPQRMGQWWRILSICQGLTPAQQGRQAIACRVKVREPESLNCQEGPQPPPASCWRRAAIAFFWARCTDMQLISSRSAAARSDRPLRMVSRRAVAWAAGS